VDISCQIWRCSLTGYTTSTMASVSSSGSAGWGSTVDTSISYATIDNGLYSYLVWTVIPASSSTLDFRSVTIGFAYPT
jgi:hypothetical protein